MSVAARRRKPAEVEVAARASRPSGRADPTAFAPPEARFLLTLQRQAGNAAVGELMRSSVPFAVQRCGGEVHAGCPCADEDAPAASAPAPHLTVARQPNPDASGFQDGTPDNPNPNLPPGSAYEHLDPELRSTLGRTLTAKSWWRWANARPTNLGAALDMVGVD